MVETFAAAEEALRGLLGRGWRLGLDRMQEFCRLLGVPHGGKTAFVHVAGTNGKGSTTAMCQSILTEHGLKTGSCFSPYVYNVRERAQIDGKLIPEEEFVAIMNLILAADEELKGTALGQITEFEAKIAMAFLYWHRQGCDAACVETGLGGRLDATNIIDPEVSILTSVSLDHTSILGDTVEQIATEKAMIIKPGRPCITGRLPIEAEQVVIDRCKETGSPLYRLGKEFDFDPEARLLTSDFWSHGIEIPQLRLRGAIQEENAACAALACRIGFGVEEAILPGLAKANLLGRFEVRRIEGRTFVFDGAHNRAATRNLCQTMQSEFSGQAEVIFGMMDGHDPSEVFVELAPICRHLYCVPISWTRTQDPTVLAQVAKGLGLSATVCDTAVEALALAEGDLVLVTGSFYLLSEVDQAFQS